MTSIKILLFLFIVIFASLGFAATSSVYAATALTNGTSVAVSLSAGAEKIYSIQVPENATGLEVTLSGGDGDLDLYLQYNAQPNLFSYDCGSYLYGNNEICSYINPTAGTWYIMVQGYSAGSSTLTATYTSGSGSVTELSNGVSEQVSLSAEEENLYFIQVPAGATKLEVKLSGGSGDLDLYTRPGSAPDTTSFACRPYTVGNNETCTHDAPPEGIWYIMVRGYSSGTATLKATYSDGGSGSVTQLLSGDPVSVSVAAGKEAFYSIKVPADAHQLQVKLSGGDGDLDIYTRYGAPPDTASYNCRPYIGGNNETCTHDAPPEGIWYIMVRGYS
ncbi:MAG: hypothetical protein D3904_17985, partial [Candidatus Electrothrix sp. EH2]|nr:hypothetical protein [Candidatus Electrothrix sp. EH2]